MSTQLTPGSIMAAFLISVEGQKLLNAVGADAVLAAIAESKPSRVKVTVSKRHGGRCSVQGENWGTIFTVWDTGAFSFHESGEDRTDPELKGMVEGLLKPLGAKLQLLKSKAAEAAFIDLNLGILPDAAAFVGDLLFKGEITDAVFGTVLDYGYFLERVSDNRQVVDAIYHGEPGQGHWEREVGLTTSHPRALPPGSLRTIAPTAPPVDDDDFSKGIPRD